MAWIWLIIHSPLFSFQSTNVYRKLVTVLSSGNSEINEKYYLSLQEAQSGAGGTAHARVLVVELSEVEQEHRPGLDPRQCKKRKEKALTVSTGRWARMWKLFCDRHWIARFTSAYPCRRFKLTHELKVVSRGLPSEHKRVKKWTHCQGRKQEYLKMWRRKVPARSRHWSRHLAHSGVLDHGGLAIRQKLGQRVSDTKQRSLDLILEPWR